MDSESKQLLCMYHIEHDHQTTRMVCRHCVGVAAPFRHLISFKRHHVAQKVQRSVDTKSRNKPQSYQYTRCITANGNSTLNSMIIMLITNNTLECDMGRNKIRQSKYWYWYSYYSQGHTCMFPSWTKHAAQRGGARCWLEMGVQLCARREQTHRPTSHRSWLKSRGPWTYTTLIRGCRQCVTLIIFDLGIDLGLHVLISADESDSELWHKY